MKIKIYSQGPKLWPNKNGNKTASDDYYWQHQLVLQQSSLSFKPLSTMQTSRTVNVVRTILQKYNQPVYYKIRPSRQYNLVRDFYPEISTRFPVNQQKDLVTATGKKLFPALSFIRLNQKPGQAIACPDNKQQGHKVLYQQHGVFKNHQLYLDQQGTEIAINITSLNKQQIRTMLQGIKQHLACKGYLLRKLLINGVPDEICKQSSQ